MPAGLTSLYVTIVVDMLAVRTGLDKMEKTKQRRVAGLNNAVHSGEYLMWHVYR